jgi:tetratricopeptide (TPR) repeat protein
MQFGMWLFEGIKAYGMFISEELGGRSEELGEIQFPSQTLAYKSGTALDIGLLYAGLLEAAGIRAALIPLGDDVIGALSLGIGQAQAATLFNGTDRILIVDDEVWLPLSMKELNNGFTAAWTAAVAELQEAFVMEEAVDFTIIEDCWAMYSPAPFPALDVRIGQPDTALISGGAAAAVNGYIATEIEPLLRETQRAAQSTPTAVNYNRLGIVQMRAGRMAEAKASYERAAGMGSVPAMNNRGNAALLENDYAGAERWFTQALQVQPENVTARRGLEQVTANR